MLDLELAALGLTDAAGLTDEAAGFTEDAAAFAEATTGFSEAGFDSAADLELVASAG